MFMFCSLSVKGQAAVGHIYLAQAAFDEAVKQFPNGHLTLRNCIMLIREYPDPRPSDEESPAHEIRAS